MSARSGLTLLEVLASLVLLTLIAAATVPVLMAAVGALKEPPARAGVTELAELAERLIEDPAAFGYGAELPAAGTIAWPQHPGRAPARFEVLAPQDTEIEHAWLALEVEGTAVFRWLPEGARAQQEAAQ